jgi:hypothetical protein
VGERTVSREQIMSGERSGQRVASGQGIGSG